MDIESTAAELVLLASLRDVSPNTVVITDSTNLRPDTGNSGNEMRAKTLRR